MNNQGNNVNVVSLFAAIFALLSLLFLGGTFLLNLIEHQEKQTNNQQVRTVEVIQTQQVEK